jgi:murein L,D-transpeptidase YafK
MLKNIAYILGSVFVFFSGLIFYGMILNAREIPLKKAMEKAKLRKLQNVKIVINRNTYELKLFSDSVLVKTYKAVFGRNKSNIKNGNDMATPRGKYKICRITRTSEYYRFYFLNYPNTKDAAEGLKKKLIDKDNYLRIVKALEKGNCPPQNTTLGGKIGIHGIGKYDFIFRNLPFVFNWTNGSVALSNEDIDELAPYLKIGTPVIIKD